MTQHWYRGYGLQVYSETALPELLPVAAGAPADLRIRLTPLAERQWTASGATEADADGFVAAPGGGFVMRVIGICDYWVRGGTEIDLSPADGADLVSVRLYLIGSALGMAFHQRGMLVLHGSTLQRQGAATIFVGESGEGKSTLAANLGRQGHAVFGDDTMPLWPRADGGFDAWPGSRMLKLWSDTIDALGETPAQLDCVGDRLDKFFFPNKSAVPDAPVPVGEIILLEAGGAETGVAVEPLAGLEALRVISQNTYRPEYVPLLGREAEHFQLCSQLAGQVTVVRLRRPWAIDRLGETLALLQARWSAPERLAGRAR
ncbi:MAG: hypothetical protein ACTSVG_06125 [Alphaproteobacteria bacterium]